MLNFSVDSLIADSAGKAWGATPRIPSKYSRQFMSLHYASSDQYIWECCSPENELATDTRYKVLRQWESHHLGAVSSSVCDGD